MLRYFWTATQKDRIRDTCTEYNLPSKVNRPVFPHTCGTFSHPHKLLW